MNNEAQNPFPFYGFEYDDPPASEAEWQPKSADWEAQWEESMRRAHESDWPEDSVHGYPRDHRATYTERLTSMAKTWQSSREGKLGEALLENDRIMMREPGDLSITDLEVS